MSRDRFGATQLKQYAAIPRRIVRVVGHPHSGWRGAVPEDSEAVEVEFTFAVTDDGSGNFLLVYESLDKRFAADSWHETIEEAFACAEESFGIRRKEWSCKAD
jgi:hypothetical protein